PVDDRLPNIGGVLGADDDVAQLAWHSAGGHRPGRGRWSFAGWRGLNAVDRKRQHVGGLGFAAVREVELGDPRRIDELDRYMPVSDLQARRDGRTQILQLLSPRSGQGTRAEHLDLDHWGSGTANGRTCALPDRRPALRTTGVLALGVGVVGLHDPLHELVAHDV